MAATRKLVCPTCSKPFKAKGDLKRHILTHTGEKPYTCKVCGKGFAQSTALRTHMNTHTGAKPFACDIDGCNKTFGDPSSRSRHRNEVHSSGGRFHCPSPGCKASMKRRHAFMQHLKKHETEAADVDISCFLYDSADSASPRVESLDSVDLFSFSPSVSPRPPQSPLGAPDTDDSNAPYDSVKHQHSPYQTYLAPPPVSHGHGYSQDPYTDFEAVLPIHLQQLPSVSLPYPVQSPSTPQYNWPFNGGSMNNFGHDDSSSALFSTKFSPQLACGTHWNTSSFMGGYELEAPFFFRLPHVFTN